MTPRKTRNAATVSDEDLRLFEQAVGKVRRMALCKIRQEPFVGLPTHTVQDHLLDSLFLRR